MKNGFKVRTWNCTSCNKTWYHPLDMQAYEEYNQLKKKNYKLKLRPVGNSWIVSIPKEIVRFQEDFFPNKMVKLSLEEPGKIAIKFTRITKFIKKQ